MSTFWHLLGIVAYWTGMVYLAALALLGLALLAVHGYRHFSWVWTRRKHRKSVWIREWKLP